MTENERLRLRVIAVCQRPFIEELERLAASDADLNAITFRFEGDLSQLAEYLEKVAATLADAKVFRLRLEGESPRND